LKASADSLHAQEKEHDFLLDAPDGMRFDAKSDRLLAFMNRRADCNAIKMLVMPLFYGDAN